MKITKEVRAARKPFLKQFYHKNRINLAVCIVVTIGLSLVGVLLSYVLQQIVDSVSGTEGSLPFSAVAWMTAALLLGSAAMGAIDSVFSPRLTSRGMRQYKTYVFEQLMKKSISSFSEESTATYLSALSNDANSIEADYLKCIWRMVEAGVGFFGAFALMLWYSPLLTLIAAAVSALPVAVSLLTGGKMAAAEQAVSRHNEGFLGILKDALSGFTVIKSFRAEKEVGGIFTGITRETEGQKCRRDRIQYAIKYLGMIAGVMAQLGVFLIGAAIAGEQKGITGGVIIAFVNLMGLAVQPIAQFPTLLAKRRGAMALIDKLAKTLSENVDERGEEIPPVLKTAITLRDVSFAYEENKPVLSGINARFEAGKSYAIVGGSGSGKSTLLNLLMAGRRNYTGEILYDERELRSIRSRSLYELNALVQQNVFVFDSTVRENITMFRSFPQEEIEKACRLSGLSELIAEKGEDYGCGENGAGLSGGERQRISIARALLRRNPVLLVDEATAALDKETAQHVTESILNIDGLTRIVVTHALEESLLKRYDGILVLKNGRLLEVGRFEELMRAKGYFYSLFTVSQGE